MATDEMLQFGINVVQLVPEFPDQINKVLIEFAGLDFGAGHVEEWT